MNIFGVLDQAIQRYLELRSRALDVDACKRGLLAECEWNARLLECLSLDDGLPQLSPGLVLASVTLRTQFLGSVLIGSARFAEAFDALHGLAIADGDEEEKGRPAKRATTALRHLYVRTELVRQLADLHKDTTAGPHAGLKTVYLKTRLSHLKRDFRHLADVLRQDLNELS